MCDTAYHNEALRRTRVLQREAERRRAADPNSFDNKDAEQAAKGGNNPFRDPTCHLYAAPDYRSYSTQPPLAKSERHLSNQQRISHMCDGMEDRRQPRNMITSRSVPNLPQISEEEDRLGKTYRSQPPLGKAGSYYALAGAMYNQKEKPADEVLLSKCYNSQAPLGRPTSFNWKEKLQAPRKFDDYRPSFPIEDRDYPSQPPLGRATSYLWQEPAAIAHNVTKSGYPAINPRDKFQRCNTGPTFNYDIYRDLQSQGRFTRNQWFYQDPVSSFEKILHNIPFEEKLQTCRYKKPFCGCMCHGSDDNKLPTNNELPSEYDPWEDY